jgi:hypothetical protein
MTVVHVAATRHVVGARSGTGLAAHAELAELIGPEALELHLRTKDRTVVELPLPVALLAVATVPDRPGALVDPMVYEVPAASTGGPTLDRLAEWPGTATVSLDATTLTLTFPNPVSGDKAVLAVVSGGGDALTGTMKDGEQTVELPVALDPGTYGVLSLVAGRHGRLDVCKVQ